MGSWDVVVSSLQDTANSDYLLSLNTPTHATPPSKQDLESIQKHKDNLSKTHRILSTALENVIELQKVSIDNEKNKSIFSSSQQLENEQLQKSHMTVDLDDNDNNKNNAKEKDKSKYKNKNKNKNEDQYHDVDKADNDDHEDDDHHDDNNNNNNKDDNKDDDGSDNDNDKSKEHETTNKEDIKSSGKEPRSLSNDSKNKSVKRQKPGRSFYQSPYNPSTPIYPGDEVAYKPRGKSDMEWIQCKVLKVINEVKFEIKDPEPDDRYPNGQLFKCTYKDLILLPNAEILLGLKNYPIGMKVLARYPETTTFYPAEIMGYKKDGTCKLRFEGEEEVGKLTEVERKLVLPYAK